MLALLLVCASVAIFHEPAQADQDYVPQGVSANLSRPCSFDGITTQVVTMTSTTAKTSSVVAAGSVRVLCTQDAHMKMAAAGVVGATATTGDVFVVGYGPEYFRSAGGVFAFVRDSADGACYVSECK